MHRAIALLVVLTLCPALARGQFDDSFPTSDHAWLLAGELVQGEDAPPFEAGDQIGVFFDGMIVGFLELTESQASNSRYSGLLVYGDDPNTNDVEGPALNEVITFRYYDESTNTVLTDLRALNSSGEPVNLRWEGGIALPPEIPLPPELRFQSNLEQDLLLGGGTGDDGDGGGGNGGGTTGDPDVNNDGKVDRADAAIVLRIALGGGRLVDEATAARADVDGDGSVTTEDAIAVLRAR